MSLYSFFVVMLPRYHWWYKREIDVKCFWCLHDNFGLVASARLIRYCIFSVTSNKESRKITRFWHFDVPQINKSPLQKNAFPLSELFQIVSLDCVASVFVGFPSVLLPILSRGRKSARCF